MTIAYDLPFERWAFNAKVRGELPTHQAAELDWAEGLLFTPELVPSVSHPLVARRGPEASRWLLAQALFTNLEFTQVLEHEVVNHAVYSIARGRSGFDLPPAMVADAWNILVDESYHGKITADLSRLAEARTGILNQAPKVPAFFLRLQREVARADPALRPLLPIFFCSISETLITKNLVEVPRDPRVIAPVRQVMKDHAEDESKHHRFFASFISQAWPQLPETFKAQIGPLLPKFMAIFIDPDIVAVRSQLRQIGLGEDDAQQVIFDCYSESSLAESRRNGARASLSALRKAGVAGSAHLRDEMHRYGLSMDVPEGVAA
ncbi:diiron oxygenase [Paracidovorax konjaci]|uniref:p-aminobenzoate N-oxygenase AurF n=1 Tax=Paracidovorax konjaci TaxID=32040 RepID=A0A1I1U9K6_9BURK|nr:diiron oxygenase [Paracidovorax konjaci]SFD64600.1 P-aminobenzoate N-oxygenase AurF [Paracidovorax konjaci]